MGRTLMKDDRYEARTEADRLIVAVVGKRPQHAPYIRIADADGNYLDSIGAAGMRRLRAAIDEALGIS